MKIPVIDGETPAEREQRTQLLHDFGAFLVMWGEFELALEVAIARRTGLSEINASIVLGGLQFGAKSNILLSLLEEQASDPSVSQAVQAIIDGAKRNALVHGAVNVDRGDEAIFSFSKREVKRAYRIIHSEYTSEQFNGHFLAIRTQIAAAYAALEITNDDINAYARKARLFGSGRPRPPAPRPSEPNGAE